MGCGKCKFVIWQTPLSSFLPPPPQIGELAHGRATLQQTLALSSLHGLTLISEDQSNEGIFIGRVEHPAACLWMFGRGHGQGGVSVERPPLAEDVLGKWASGYSEKPSEVSCTTCHCDTLGGWDFIALNNWPR